MLYEEHHVFFEASTRRSLLKVMDRLAPWLDDNEIRPIHFKQTVAPSGAIELQMTFKNRQDAALFEQAFCQAEAV